MKYNAKVVDFQKKKFRPPQEALGNNTESTLKTKKRSHKERYALRNQSAITLGTESRVYSCGKVPANKFAIDGGIRPGVSISESGRAGIHGVSSCGSAYTCPVCAIKIAEKKRLQILAALNKHYKDGGTAILVTWTFSHGPREQLQVMMRQFMKALSRMKGRRAFSKAIKSIGYIGQIRSLEVTYGDVNGWHPHCHEIWLLDRKATYSEIKALEATLYEIWSKVAVACGLGKPSRKHGIDMRYTTKTGADAVGKYVSKWCHELTYHHTKKAGRGGRSPWQILGDLHETYKNYNHREYTRNKNLWQEYARAMHGRAQLFWSKGLKAKYGIDDKSDKELATLPDRQHMHTFDDIEWHLVRKYNKFSQVLTAAEKSRPWLLRYLAALVNREKRRLKSFEETKRSIRIHTESVTRELKSSGLSDWQNYTDYIRTREFRR